MKHRRILIIDDDPLVRRTLHALLNQAGYTVDSAAGGVEGLEKLPAGHFDLVITDVRMPGMDGFAVLRAIREYCEAAHRPPFEEVVLNVFSLCGDFLKRAVNVTALHGLVLHLITRDYFIVAQHRDLNVAHSAGLFVGGIVTGEFEHTFTESRCCSFVSGGNNQDQQAT